MHKPDFYCQHVLALKRSQELLWLLDFRLKVFVINVMIYKYTGNTYNNWLTTKKDNHKTGTLRLEQGHICEEVIGGPKSRSEQSEVEDSYGFWCSCKPQNGLGRSLENFQICVSRRITQSSSFIWNKYKGHASHEIYLGGNWWWMLMNIKFLKLSIITWLILTENGIR